jgi:CBS domain containing-hemolysin-like protein
MNADVIFWIELASILVVCFASLGARAFRDFSRHDLAEITQRKGRLELLTEILRYHDRVALSAESLQVFGTALLAAALTTDLWNRDPRPDSTFWITLGLLSAILLVGQLWIPWALSRLGAAFFLYHTWRIWQIIHAFLKPLGWCARFVDTFLHRLAGRKPQVNDEATFEHEIRTIVTQGHREGLLEEDAREMIEGVIELGDATVSEIMTPRTDMISMPVSLSIQEAVQFAIETAHSRIPVHDETRDDIVGVLYVKDILPILAKGTQDRTTLAEILRKPCFVPETKPVDALLQEFQRTHNHMAVVLDEYGGVSGLVTFEDALEEIVGEIVDEYDPDLVEEIKRIDHTTTEALARAHIDEINQQLGLHLTEEGDFDTIGGYVFSELGYVPTAGEELLRDNVRITVLDATPRRIERVRIQVLDRNGQDEQPHEG